MSEPDSAKLKQFAERCFEAAWEGDVDSGDVQEWGIELGLLEQRKVNPDENEWGADELFFWVWNDKK